MNYRLAHVIAGFLPLKSWRREFREKYCKKQKSRTEWMLEACFEKVVKLEHENQLLLELSRGIGERLSRDEGKSGFNSFQMLCAPAVHQLKHDKIRVVFLLHNVAAVDTLLPVMRSMAQDDRYEVIPAAVDRRFPGDADFHGGDEVELYFKNQKVPVLRLYAYPDDEAVLMLRTLQPDVVFRQAPWEPDIKPIYSVTQLLFTRLVYIPYYGAHICRTMSQDTQEHLHEDQLLHRLAWKVFVDRGSLENYIRYNGMLARNLVVCDSPKYEYLSEELVRRSSKQSEKRWKKMIVWAPHHSSSSQWLGFGTFAYVWKQMLEYVRQHPAYQFVFRPHPAFRLGYVASGTVAKEEMDQFWKEWQSLPNALISGGATILIYLENLML